MLSKEEIVNWVATGDTLVGAQPDPAIGVGRTPEMEDRINIVRPAIVRALRSGYKRAENEVELAAGALLRIGLSVDDMPQAEYGENGERVDIPVNDTLIQGLAANMFAESNPTHPVGARTVRSLRRGFSRYTLASNVLADESLELNPYVRRRYVDDQYKYRHYKDLYIDVERGHLSYNRLDQMFEQGTVRELYDIGDVSGYVLETFIRSVKQVEQSQAHISEVSQPI